MYCPKKLKFLEKVSLYLEKDKDFIRDIMVKFLMCIPYNDRQIPTLEDFHEDHYYIIVYFILIFDDHKNIHSDQVMAIIYIVYTFFVDDWGAFCEILYPGIENYTIGEFESVCIQLSLKFSKNILDILKNNRFHTDWKIKCDQIINYNMFICKKQILLKEIFPNLNKRLLNGR